MSQSSAPRGKVYLIGAGPGDPGMITLRGVECLRRADVVLYDYLVNPVVIEHAPPTAERVCLGQHGVGDSTNAVNPTNASGPGNAPAQSDAPGPSNVSGEPGPFRLWTQDEINTEMVRRARLGQTVARLKGGDPSIFGRAAEEMEYLAAAGVPYEMAPGVTAALAAAATTGVPLTHRQSASTVAFVTGHEGADKQAAELDWAALAKFPGTLVLYMALTTAPRWSQSLMAGGLPPGTPAAIVRRCGLPDQQTIHTTLAGAPGELAKLRPPVVVILGEVARLGPALSWFEKRPLFGRAILVSRPAEQAAALAEPLAELGAEVLSQPAIEIGPPDDPAPLDAALANLRRWRWIVFSSGNGVKYFFDRLQTLGRDARALCDASLAAIGPGTAAELARLRLRADLTPSEFRAEALAEALLRAAERETGPSSFLLARASRGREVLGDTLRAAGHVVDQVVAYSSRDVAAPDPIVARRLREGRVAWATVTSSAIARGLVRLFGDDVRRAKLASISPVTSATLRECGFEPTVEAREYTMPGVIEAILEHERSGRDAAAPATPAT